MNTQENKNIFRKTKIVATLGPACHSVEKMVEMINAGMNCARFNFSHGDHAEHKSRYDMLQKAMKITGKYVALLLDTKGPEIRTGTVNGDPIEIIEGQDIIVSGQTKETTKDVIGLSYANIHNEVQPGKCFKIADGFIVLEVKEIKDTDVICKVITGGKLSSRKNVNIPDTNINLPNISERDITDIKFGIKHEYNYIAASFIRTAEAVLIIKDILKEHDSHINVIAKIENQQGLNNIESISQVADGIMIARGDLAEQIPPEQVPLVQKSIIKSCIHHKKITITATQMLQSMEQSLTPTRAELTDVANAIFDGSDAVMLSGETAQGAYPVEAIKTMHKVAMAVECSSQFKEHAIQTFFSAEKNALLSESDTGGSLIAAALIVADKTSASAFACPTLTGSSPRILSSFKPAYPILATTHVKETFANLLLVWGVYPALVEQCHTDVELIDTSIKKAKEIGFLKKNGKIVIIAGLPINKPLMLNTIQIHFEGTTIARGRQGCGKTIQGKFYKVHHVYEIPQHQASNNNEPYIYCVPRLHYSDLFHLKDIRGLLVEGPSLVPLEIIEKQFPNMSCITNIGELLFQAIEQNREIIISGAEKIIYEP